FPDSIAIFDQLTDPRKGRNKQHYFGEILFIALAAIICQCEGFDDMERFAKGKESWLKKHLKLPNGTPSNDTFRRVFTAIDPKAFNACLITFTEGLIPNELSSQLIAIDGKAVRHSFDNATQSKHLHLLSAYACDAGLSLAQLAVDEKTNEITAVPELLDYLDIEGHTVSLDAMGCQKQIARQIHFANADYLFALKANHPYLHQKVGELFSSAGALQYAKNQGHTFSSINLENKGHGRLEKRVVLATDALSWIDKNERESWLGLKSLVCVESHREDISSGKSSVEKRYYLTSHKPDAQKLQKLIRQHWLIENSCHWILDVVWDEDSSQIRKGNAAENVALLRKVALNILKVDTTIKDTIRGKRLQATFSEDVLEKLLALKVS
ncbi:ISAs1 family transposase, partial [Akkermansiaceae bacterium]|nr:ISAs1 family transposase [Akkermansiaceae bacterium]